MDERVFEEFNGKGVLRSDFIIGYSYDVVGWIPVSCLLALVINSVCLIDVITTIATCTLLDATIIPFDIIFTTGHVANSDVEEVLYLLIYRNLFLPTD